jgi:hypothetical protein
MAIAVSTTGQEDPLPAVHSTTAESTIAAFEPAIVLAVEPVRTFSGPSLADAARANDFVTFDALYKAAKARGASVGAFDTLHEVWAWSMADPIGAFYGPDLHARLAAAYPGFARYIDEYRVVDNRGNVFYPTSETRAFLLDRALEGRATPRVNVAEAAAPAPAVSHPARRHSTRTSHRVPARPATKTAAPAAAKAPVTKTATKPTTTAAPAPAPVVPANVPAVAPQQAAPQQAAQQQPAQQPVQQPAATTEDFSSRGILLLVIGLIGVGLLAVILRTPKEIPATILPAPVDAAKGDKPATVEPFRKTPSQNSPKSEEASKPRANESRG